MFQLMDTRMAAQRSATPHLGKDAAMRMEIALRQNINATVRNVWTIQEVKFDPLHFIVCRSGPQGQR